MLPSLPFSSTCTSAFFPHAFLSALSSSFLSPAGVYRRAWLTDGRINHFTETGLSRIPSKFEGHTNTGSNETIHSLSHMLRPNLAQGKGFKP